MASRLIATTKLAIPRPLRVTVPRPALLARLDEPTYRVGVVCAPVGFGKTALLATWAAGRREPTAWLSCDATDREPTRFWTALLMSVCAQWPGVGDDAAVELERAGPDSQDLAVLLANDLGDVDGPVVVIIDDLHLARPAARVLQDLPGMLPANVRLVIGSRVDPPFSLARHRLAGSLVEIRGDELRFTITESAALLDANDIAPMPAELRRLHDLTEGWPAGIQVAALAWARAGDRARFLDALASTDQALTEFMVDEVMAHQPADRVEFLLATSVLEDFDADLCAAVTGRADAGALLHDVVEANLFVVPTGGGRFRYHHLFAEFLRARLAARGRQHVAAARERASTALEARGDVVGALHQATANGDLERAAAVVQHTFARWMNVVDAEMTAAAARYWLIEHGPTAVVSDPERVLEFVLALIVTSSPGDAAQWLTRVERAHPDASPELTAYLHGVWAEHHLQHGQPEEALDHAEQAMAAVGGEPPGRDLFPTLPMPLARAHLDSGHATRARAVLDAAIDRPTGHATLDDVRIPAMRGWIAFLDGRLDEAARRARSAMDRADVLGLPRHEPGRLFAGLALAGVLDERGDDAAVALLEDVSERVDVGGRVSFRSLVALRRAALARLHDDEAAADRHLTDARLLLPDASSAMRETFSLEAAEQALRFRQTTARDAIDRLVPSDRATVLATRCALVAGDDRAAGRLLDTLAPPTTTREHVERGVLRALSTMPRDAAAAERLLAGCLAVAQPEHFIRTIVDHGPVMSRLLASSIPDRGLAGYVEELIVATTAAPTHPRPLVAAPLVDPLSARELTVLRYLTSRLTNEEIAAALYVSLNTLKTHVKSIYRKLAVASRREAVDTGRQLRLI